jgi:hypothetical protein
MRRLLRKLESKVSTRWKDRDSGSPARDGDDQGRPGASSAVDGEGGGENAQMIGGGRGRVSLTAICLLYYGGALRKINFVRALTLLSLPSSSHPSNSKSLPLPSPVRQPPHPHAHLHPHLQLEACRPRRSRQSHAR